MLRWELRLSFTKIVADRDLSSLQWRRACGLRPDVELRDWDVGTVRCVVVYFFVCLSVCVSSLHVVERCAFVIASPNMISYERICAARSSKLASAPCPIGWIPVVTLVKACAVCMG